MSLIEPRAARRQAVHATDAFPLPLTPLESFMVADSRPEFPMMCDLELEFQGRIERAAFETALADALDRHPIYRARVERRRGQDVWVSTNAAVSVDWAPLGTSLGERYDTLVDLTREAGLRIWVRHSEERSTILLHFHHACSDAVGAFGFIEDLLASYAAACDESAEVDLRTLDPERLLGRGTVGLADRSLARKLSDVYVGSRYGARLLFGKPLVLPAMRDAPPATERRLEPAFLVHHCSNELTMGLRRAATAANASVNDLLLRDLFLTFRRWQNSHGPLSDGKSLCVLMPQNLRQPEDRLMPAVNMMSFSFVRCRAEECDAPAKLLQSISEETSRICRNRLSLYFLENLAAARAFGALSWILHRDTCFATAVLTNPGDATRRFTTRFARRDGSLVVGNLILRRITGVPPVRPFTRAAFSITTTAQELSISLKCDPRTYSPLDAQRLLDEYVNQLRETATALSPVGV